MNGLSPEFNQENQRFEISIFAQSLCEIAAHLNSDCDLSQLKRRVQFLIFDIRSQISLDESLSEKVHKLSRLFFLDKNYKITNEPLNENFSVSTHLLDNCLTKKTGTLDITCGLYFILCEALNIKAEFLNLYPPCYLKFYEDGHTFYVDLSQMGRELETEDMLQIINKYYSELDINDSHLMAGMSSAEFLDHYIAQIQSRLKANSRFDSWRSLQNIRMTLKPESLGLIAERALVHYEMGLHKEALLDLKRYFSFVDYQQAPSRLALLYEHLNSKKLQ